MTTANSVEITNVTYTYPRREAPALRLVSLSVSSGQVLAVMGPTGAGKTTLVSLLNGLIPHYFEGQMSGKVLIDSLSTYQHRIQDLVQHVGLVMQDPETQIFGITVLEDTAFGPSNLGFSRDTILALVKEALEEVRLSGYEDRLTANLSGGEKQRLALAGVLSMQPAILALDEPTSELDPVGREEVLASIRELRDNKHTTVILVEHETEDVLQILDGNLVWFGEPRELFRDVPKTISFSIRPPKAAELGAKLVELGWLPPGEIPLTVEEAQVTVRNLLGDRKFKAYDPASVYPNTARGSPIIEVRDLSHVYPGGIQALSKVDLDICEREFIAIIGQNGAGKSTLVKHFNGLLRPTSGSVKVFGVDTQATNTRELSRHVGYVFQNPDHQIFSASVEEEIRFGLTNIGLDEEEQQRRIQEALDFVGLADKRDRHPFMLGKGERQKVAVASILAIAPQVIIIDEPTTGLDWAGTKRMMALIRELHQKGHTVLMITHNMEIVAEYAGRVILLNQGRVLMDGTPSQVFEDHQALRAGYLEPPAMARLSQELADLNCPQGIVNLDQMLQLISDALG
jgi:energy-coupling factor transport system ATP-binding protein